MARVFAATDYPHGCRCASCHNEFTEGDPMIDRPMGELAGLDASTPVCSTVCLTGPLPADHPLLADDVLLRADGLVGR